METSSSSHHTFKFGNLTMKLTLTIILSLLISSSFAQTNWASIEREIALKRDEGRITSGEWYQLLKKDAGSLTSQFSLWVEDDEKIPVPTKEKKLKLYFAKDFQISMPNGNKFAQLFLENHTENAIEIPRIDATIANVQEYFFIGGNWIKGRTNHTSTCGNSYFNKALGAGDRLNLHLNNDSLVEGDKKVSYKITVTIGNKVIESNVIKIRLYKNQLTRLAETI
jgi:hypothetical protein